jgi:hypothetical protein
MPRPSWLRAALPVLLGLAAALLVVAGAARAEFEPQFQPTIRVARAAGPIRVDGELDDAAWASAARATGFAETSPGDQIEPPVRSEAWITYDDECLYVALVADDDPREVRRSVCERDKIFSDDYFGVMFDPYGDQTSGYELFVNPLGIQGDLRMLPGGDEDSSFDIVWSSRGRVTDHGYQVELAIPFASLRLPDRREQTWRVNFWRDRQRDKRNRYAWAAIDRNNPCFMCNFGTMTGLEVADTGRRVEMIASLIGTQAGTLADTDDPGSRFDNASPDAEGSASLKYGLTSSTFAELAINPDFSQVESDAGQIDVNQTFALFFTEKRPFFQEGSDLYGTWIDAIYTRSINDPSAAGKLTMQRDGVSGVYTFARDEHSPLILPREDQSDFVLLDESVSNVLRLRRAIRGGSHVGALFTDRRVDGGGSGTAGGLDANFRRGAWSLEAQGLLSRTAEPNLPQLSEDEDLDGTFGRGRTVALDGERYSGHASYLSVERGGRFFQMDADYWDFSPEFRADNGFVTRNDYRQASSWQGLQFRPNGRWISEWSPSVGIGRIWDYDGSFQDEWLRPQVWFRTRLQTEIGAQYLISRERFGPDPIPGIRITSFWLNTRPWEWMGFGGDGNVGQGIYRDLDAPELADQLNLSAYVSLKLARRITSDLSWDYARMDSRERDESLFAGYILRNRFTVNFTQQWFVRLVIQWDGFDEQLDVEPLLTYRINPFTVFYAGSTSRLQRYDAGDVEGLSGDEWRQTSRQFFAKLQYQFHL